MNKVKLTLLLLFFFSIPPVGMLWFWNDMHAKIQTNSRPYVEESLKEVFGEWNYSIFAARAGAAMASTSIPKPEFDKLKERLGSLKSVGPLQKSKSYAADFEDQIWQHVYGDVELQFEKGAADVKISVKRPYLSKWVIEDLKITPR